MENVLIRFMKQKPIMQNSYLKEFQVFFKNMKKDEAFLEEFKCRTTLVRVIQIQRVFKIYKCF
jgi:hypothetical protein